jgi:hypothetical protein
VTLGWPSSQGEIYIVQWRSNAAPGTAWVTLTNSLPANLSSNWTVFVHSNQMQCLSGSTNTGHGHGGGPPPVPSLATEATVAPQVSEPVVIRADGSGGLVPLCIYPPGFDLSAYLIFDPPTGEWLSGAGYITGQPSLNRFLHPSPQPQDHHPAPPDPGFYQVVRVGAHSVGITNGMRLSGVVTIPVELGQPSGQLTTVTLEDWGVPIASSIHVAPFERPVPLLVLDTTLISNGVHSISVHAQWTDPGDGTEDGSAAIYEAYSPAVSVAVSNELSFPGWMPEFGELGNSLVVSAQSGHTNVQWYLDVYDSHYNYIGTMGGTTPDGNIYVVWNLVGPPPNYTLYTDNTFEFVLSTAMGGQLLASKVVPGLYRVADPWNGPGDWVVVNQQAWNNLVGSDMLDTQTDGFAQTAQGLGLTARPTAPAGTAYRLRYGASDPNGDYDWAAFRSALYNNLSRNLFYLGHGSPAGLGYNQTTTNRSILATEIGKKLATISAGLTNKHKYRFVCLDGCSTASGTLPESFGIIHKQNVSGGYYADASLRPSAYAGWNDDKAAGFAGSINVSHVYYFQHFLYEWLIGGNGVKTAFDHAAGYPDVTFLNTGQMRVFGDWDLGINAYNR